MTLRLALIVLVATLFAGVARAETCTSSDDMSWTAVTDAGSWTGSPCTPSAGDDFIIASGHTVTITDGAAITQDTTASIGVTVQSGGTLETATLTSRTVLTVGEDGLDCQLGSTCNFAGAYRESGVASPGTVSAPSSFEFGRTELGTGAATATIEWASGTFNAEMAGKGDPFIWEAVNEIIANDILCFWDFDTTTLRTPVDHGYCYEVTAVNMAGDPRTVTLSVRQGSATHSSSPIADRDTVQTTLTNAETKGSRTIEVANLIIGADRDYIGRWLRFATGGNEENTAFRICDSNATTDAFTLCDIRGINKDHAAAENVWIDYGWSIGDEFFVMIPFVITSATAPATDHDDSPVQFNGTYSLEAVLIDGTDSIDSDGGTPSLVQHVWVRDQGAGNGNAIGFTDPTTDVTINHLTLTGVDEDPDAAGDGGRTHGIIVSGVANLTANDIAIRHHGDDAIGNQSANPVTGSVTMARIRVQDITSAAVSAEMIQFNSSTATFDVDDWECVDCADNAGGSTTVFGGGASLGVSTIDKGVMLGNRAALGNLDNDDAGTWTRDLTWIGGGPQISADMLAPRVDRFVLREVTCITGANCRVADSEVLRNGLIRSLNTTDDPLRMSDGADYDNLAIIDHTTSGAATNDAVILVSYPDAGSTARADRILIAWSDGTQTLDEHAVRYTGTPNGTEDIDFNGLGIAGFDYDTGGGGSADMFNGDNAARVAQTDYGTLCLWRNDTNHGTEVNTTATSVVVGVFPGFSDEGQGAFYTPKGASWDANKCGVKRGQEAPGVQKSNLPLQWSRLEPEFLGPKEVGTAGGYARPGAPPGAR